MVSAMPVVPPLGVATAGAVTRDAAAPCCAVVMVPNAPSIAPAKPTVSRTGVMTATVRRTLVAALRPARNPEVRPSSANGPAARPVSGRTTAGSSITAPVISSATIGRNRAGRPRCAGCRAPPPAARPRPARPGPTIQRSTVIDRRSPAASRSASAGRVRPARRAAANEPARAMSSPAPNAAAAGHQMNRTSRPAGANPWRASQCANGRAITGASATPVTAAATPTARASPSTIRRTCRGVAPTVRSSPNSRRRAPTA